MSENWQKKHTSILKKPFHLSNPKHYNKPFRSVLFTEPDPPLKPVTTTAKGNFRPVIPKLIIPSFPSYPQNFNR